MIFRKILPATLLASFLIFLSSSAMAQSLTLNMGAQAAGDATTARLLQLVAVITVLSLAPAILIMVTSFTRIVVVLSLLRSALGTQTSPPNMVLISLALFLTGFVMAPTFQVAYDKGIAPLIAGEIDNSTAFDRTINPFHAFMRQHTRSKDIQLFMDLGKIPAITKPEDLPLRALIPAFMISELYRAFEIGFLLYLPFLIIDMVIASILMAMGMMMLPPVVISVPFKIVFFVLVDGWYLVCGSLVQSYLGN